MSRRRPRRGWPGFASRFTAFAVDAGISLGVFLLALAAVSFAARVLTGQDITWHKGDIWVIIAYAAWAFIYFACSWAASGRTAGMALLGVRVVQDDGTDASGRCTTSSPGRRSSTPGTREPRGCGSCPGADSSSGLVRLLPGHRVGVLDGDPGARYLDLADRDGDLEDSLVVTGGDVRRVDPGG